MLAKIRSLAARAKTAIESPTKVATMVRHFSFTAAAVFLTATAPLIQHLAVGKVVHVSDVKAAALAGLAGVVTAAGRLALPAVLGFIARNPAPPAPPAPPVA